eukprot:CAMPEP_0177760878 /NCGR_PEP_ID=MMETSP0491_2-20121128/5505_1 /TAXON_ID=63592 /ORGANISM="Tetraselmis chuii, Strain PLY429" /LENGTH=401 /DNA_ID=CAMNT_0019276813 /DNA_START=161 /DNA_END=1366 /DNA_ORIENTATION=+
MRRVSAPPMTSAQTVKPSSPSIVLTSPSKPTYSEVAKDGLSPITPQQPLPTTIHQPASRERRPLAPTTPDNSPHNTKVEGWEKIVKFNNGKLQNSETQAAQIRLLSKDLAEAKQKILRQQRELDVLKAELEQTAEEAGEWQIQALTLENEYHSLSSAFETFSTTRDVKDKVLLDMGERVMQVETMMAELVAETEAVLHERDAEVAGVREASVREAQRLEEAMRDAARGGVEDKEEEGGGGADGGASGAGEFAGAVPGGAEEPGAQLGGAAGGGVGEADGGGGEADGGALSEGADDDSDEESMALSTEVVVKGKSRRNRLLRAAKFPLALLVGGVMGAILAPAKRVRVPSVVTHASDGSSKSNNSGPTPAARKKAAKRREEFEDDGMGGSWMAVEVGTGCPV